MKTRALAYLRVSTEDQNLGIPAQRAAIELWAEQNSVAVVAWFSDHCSGAVNPYERVGFNALLAAADGVDFVVAQRRDRLARDLLGIALLERDLLKKQIRIVTAQEDPSMADTPERQLIRNVTDAMSEYERALVRDRTKRALAVLKAKGVKLGRPTYDSRKGKRILREMKELLDLGLTCRKVAIELNTRRVFSLCGHSWNARTVAKVAKQNGLAEKL